MNYVTSSVIASSLLLVLGCSSEPSASSAGAGGTTGATSATGTGGNSSTTGSGSSCEGAIGELPIPGASFCAGSAAFGDIYRDDSGKPLGFAMMVSDAPDSCTWFKSQPNKPQDLTFAKVDVYGPVPGTCAIYTMPGDPSPPFATCVAVVKSVKIKGGKEFGLRAKSGSVEVTAASDASLTAKVSVSFPEAPYYLTDCGGMVGGVSTCNCVDDTGDTKKCMTSEVGGNCCNDGSTGDVQAAWTATAPKCPEMCLCSTDVGNCPCL